MHSLAVVFLGCDATIAKARGLDDATRYLMTSQEEPRCSRYGRTMVYTTVLRIGVQARGQVGR